MLNSLSASNDCSPWLTTINDDLLLSEFHNGNNSQEKRCAFSGESLSELKAKETELRQNNQPQSNTYNKKIFSSTVRVNTKVYKPTESSMMKLQKRNNSSSNNFKYLNPGLVGFVRSVVNKEKTLSKCNEDGRLVRIVENHPKQNTEDYCSSFQVRQKSLQLIRPIKSDQNSESKSFRVSFKAFKKESKIDKNPSIKQLIEAKVKLERLEGHQAPKMSRRVSVNTIKLQNDIQKKHSMGTNSESQQRIGTVETGSRNKLGDIGVSRKMSPCSTQKHVIDRLFGDRFNSS